VNLHVPPAVAMLARGWRRGARRWYRGTTAVLAAVLFILLTTAGVLAGTEHETASRVGDFYTGGLRLTPSSDAAVPEEVFEASAALAGLGLDMDEVRIQYESQAVLTRQTLLEAALEKEGFDVDAPGTRPGRGAIGLAALLGVDVQDPAVRDALEPHLVVGSLPRMSGQGAIPLVMSLDRLDRFLGPEERASMPWPPRLADLSTLRFQITAARLEGNESLAQGGMFILRSAYVAGLFRTGVDVLDGFTLVAPIEDVRSLNAAAPGTANVLLVPPDQAAGARAAAARLDWRAQDAGTFTKQYLGQVIDVMRLLGGVSAAALFLLPSFLIVHGVTRQLEAHNREIAVCQAIGVPGRRIRGALGWVVARMVAAAVVLAALATAGTGLVLHGILPGLDGSPLPMDFRLPPGTALLALVVTLGSVAGALALAFRSQRDLGLAETLRTF